MSALNEMKMKMMDLLEEHFPKGESKERGRAMVLVAETLIAMREILAGEKKK